MARVNLSLPIYMPDRILSFLRKIRRTLTRKPSASLPVRNLLGDRDVEWSWVAARMPAGPGEALDFGPGGSALSLLAALRGFRVTAVDLDKVNRPYQHANLKEVQGDLLKLPLPPGRFDLVINCSTVEHVGLAGRYGVTEERPDGDLGAMARLREMLKPGGVMLLTVPVGLDAVFAPLCRAYGAERLPRLLSGYALEEETFWIKNTANQWIVCPRAEALAFSASVWASDALRNVHALGCFRLRR
jgi:SAM-dependent methyltransferase